MKVEILEESIKHFNDEAGLLETFVKGEVRNVPDHIGEYFCGLGWAKDVDGKVETGQRDTSRKVLFVDKGQAGHKASEAG